MVKLETLSIVNRSIIINFFENVGCLRWHPNDYAITSTLIFLDVSKFGDCCLIAHLAFLFTQIDRLWHDACSLDTMERNAYIRACELSQPWIQFDY